MSHIHPSFNYRHFFIFLNIRYKPMLICYTVRCKIQSTSNYFFFLKNFQNFHEIFKTVECSLYNRWYKIMRRRASSRRCFLGCESVFFSGQHFFLLNIQRFSAEIRRRFSPVWDFQFSDSVSFGVIFYRFSHFFTEILQKLWQTILPL